MANFITNFYIKFSVVKSCVFVLHDGVTSKVKRILQFFHQTLIFHIRFNLNGNVSKLYKLNNIFFKVDQNKNCKHLT